MGLHAVTSGAAEELLDPTSTSTSQGPFYNVCVYKIHITLMVTPNSGSSHEAAAQLEALLVESQLTCINLT
jgi:hypothetical protein